jgi:hypothetical protein
VIGTTAVASPVMRIASARLEEGLAWRDILEGAVGGAATGRRRVE